MPENDGLDDELRMAMQAGISGMAKVTERAAMRRRDQAQRDQMTAAREQHTVNVSQANQPYQPQAGLSGAEEAERLLAACNTQPVADAAAQQQQATPRPQIHTQQTHDQTPER